MSEKRNDPVVSLAGNVSRVPIRKQAGDKPVVEFGLAVTGGYGDEAPTYFYDCSVWNDGLQESVMREVFKGGKVAVEGFFTQREYQGKTYNKISVVRVGIVEYLQRTKAAAAPAAVSAGPAAVPGMPAAAAADASW